jgi:hypothetical protein
VDATKTTAPTGMGRASVYAALFAGTCNILSLIFVIYQNSLRGGELVLNYPEVVSYCFLLTPLLVVIVFRHVAAITLSYALMLLAVLAGRIYYLVQFHLVGIGAFVQTMDLPGLGSILLSGVSLVILLLSVVIVAARLIDNVGKRDGGAGTDG